MKLNTSREQRDAWVKEGYGLRAPLAADVNALEDELARVREAFGELAKAREKDLAQKLELREKLV